MPAEPPIMKTAARSEYCSLAFSISGPLVDDDTGEAQICPAGRHFLRHCLLYGHDVPIHYTTLQDACLPTALERALARQDLDRRG